MVSHIEDDSDLIILREHIYLINRGVRDCAWLDCKLNMYSKVCEKLDKNKLKHYDDEVNTGSNFLGVVKRIFIYKYEHQLNLFKFCLPFPRTYEKHYILGKLFGYSDKAIEEFLSRQEIACSVNQSLFNRIEQFYSINLNSHFIEFIHDPCKFPRVREFYDTIKDQISYSQFINTMKICYFNDYCR